MPIIPFLVTIAFFIVINLFLALFLSSLVVAGFKLAKYPVETFEMSFLIFICCSAIWIGLRVILLNFYSFDHFSDAFIWPMSSFMPKDIVLFLESSTGMGV